MRQLPPLELRKNGPEYHDDGYFLRSANADVEMLGVTSDDNVLDIGCGPGRLVYGLPAMTTYTGVDTERRSIDWAKKALPDFRWCHHDLYHPRYNPQGSLLTPAPILPEEQAEYTAIVLLSVFTHTPQNESTALLSDIGRLLVPDGRAYATFFLSHETRNQGSGDSWGNHYMCFYDAHRLLREVEESGLEVFGARNWRNQAGLWLRRRV